MRMAEALDATRSDLATPAPALADSDSAAAGAPAGQGGDVTGLDLGDVADDERSLEEVAAFFDKSEPTVRDWIMKGGCPVVQRGGRGVAYKLSLRAVAAWLDEARQRQRAEVDRKRATDEQLRMELLGADGSALPELAPGLSPRETAEALAAEVNRTKLAEMRGDLVRASGIEAAIAEAFKLFQEGVRLIPERLAEQFQMADDQADALLEGLDGELDALSDRLAVLTPKRSAAPAQVAA